MSTKRQKQQRANTKRQQKRGAKAAERAKLNRGKKRPAPGKITKSAGIRVTEEMLPQSEYHFWLSHGVNYLLSDYDKGTWTPVFPDLYDGKIISQKEIIEKLMGRQNEGVYKYAFAWALTPRESVWIYRTEIMRLLASKGSQNPQEDAKKPHQPLVWETFAAMLARWVGRVVSEETMKWANKITTSPPSAPESPDPPAPA